MNLRKMEEFFPKLTETSEVLVLLCSSLSISVGRHLLFFGFCCFLDTFPCLDFIFSLMIMQVGFIYRIVVGILLVPLVCSFVGIFYTAALQIPLICRFVGIFYTAVLVIISAVLVIICRYILQRCCCKIVGTFYVPLLL